MRFKKEILIILLTVILSLLSFGVSANEDVHLILGSGSKPTSSFFPFHATTNKLIDDAPGIMSTLMVVDGSVGGAMAILRGENIDITGGLALTTIYEMTHGMGMWKDNPLPNDLRVLISYLSTTCPIVVTEASGVNEVAGLNGKIYGMGYQGSSSQVLFDAAFKALGLDVRTDQGSFEDAIEDMKDGRLIGYAKATPSVHLDSAFQDVMLTKKLKIIGWSDSDVKIIKEKAPYVSFVKTPANHYLGIEHPEIWDLSMPMVWVCHKDMPEEVAYKIAKSYTEGWEEELLKVFPTMANDNPVDTPMIASQVEGVLVHPGSLRYFKEIGSEIPSSVIPPEMQ